LAATYDASLRELDALFADLLKMLEARGALENTVVVLAADHGELLGEHGLLDHQYSLYQPLVRVPLVLWAPGRVPAGRSAAPVMALDVYATLLQLAGDEAGARPTLLEPSADRVRLAEYPAVFSKPFQSVAAKAKPGALDRFRRRLRALFSGPFKLIEGEDGNDELYDLAADPDERSDLSRLDAETHARLRASLHAFVSELDLQPASGGATVPTGGVGDEEAALLEQLGYSEALQAGAEAPREFDVPSSWKLDANAH